MNKILKISAAFAVALSVAAFSGCEILEQFLGHTHDMQYVAAKDATCTSDGNTAYYHCTLCGANFSDKGGNDRLETVVIAALGHEMQYMPEKAPTCAEEGNIGYYKCSRCGGTFTDSEGEISISADDVILGKTAHTYSADIWEYDSRTHWNECSECGEHLNGAAHTYGADNSCTVCGYMPGENDVIAGNEEDITSAELSIHFIELGNKYTGDCTLIKVGDTEVLIDAGSRQSSAQVICDYISAYCQDGILEYVIATHAHQDHIAGFVGNSSGNSRTGVLYNYEIDTFIQFALSDATSNIYKNYCEAVDYIESQGANVYTAEQCIEEADGAQTVYYLDENETISMTVLDNYYYRNSAAKTDGEENNYSVCILLTQQLADGEENNYLFTGDLEAEGEELLVELNDLPQVQLFKGGHHGSYTASSDALLSVIKPEAVAVCCCCGTTEYRAEPENRFPAQAFIDRVAKYTDAIYCTTLIVDYSAGEYTSMNGDIVFYFGKAEGEEEGSLKLWCSNNSVKLKDTAWFAANRTWPEADGAA